MCCLLSCGWNKYGGTAFLYTSFLCPLGGVEETPGSLFWAETSEEDTPNLWVVQRMYSMHMEWARADDFLRGIFHI